MTRHPLNTTLFLSLFCVAANFSWAEAVQNPLTLEEMIHLSVSHHPKTKEDSLREQAIQKNVDIARSRYYPAIDAMAVISSGFPGSTGALEIQGLMGSPFRQGLGIGLLAKQSVTDFGRTSGAVDVAQKELELATIESAVSSLGIAVGAVRAFYMCSKDKSLVEDYEILEKESRNIANEVASFVKKRQRSVVDRYLSQAQAEEAVTLTETHRKKLELDYAALTIYTGKDGVQCPYLAAEPSDMGQQRPHLKVVYLVESEKRLAVSEARLQLAKRDYFPRVVALGSVGYLQGAHLSVPVQNYSIGVGVIWPIFEGFITNSRVDQERIRTEQFKQEYAAIEQQLKEAKNRYVREIESSKVQIRHLNDELALAKIAFSLAKSRYQKLQGNLIDLREAVRNLSRTHTQLRDAQAVYFSQHAELELILGWQGRFFRKQ